MQNISTLPQFIHIKCQQLEKFISDIEFLLKTLLDTFNNFKDGIKEKYSKIKSFNQLNALQLNQALSEMIQFNSEKQYQTKEDFKTVISNLDGLIKTQLKELELERGANDEEKQQAQVLYDKGCKLYQQLRFEEAIIQLNESLNIIPNAPFALHQKGRVLQQSLGECLMQLKKYTEALTLFDKALIKQPKHVDILFSKGESLRRLNKFQDAITYYDKVLSIKSAHLNSLFSKGECLRLLNCFNEAISWFNKALNVKYDHVRSLCSKGDCLRMLNQYDEAIFILDNALQIDPKSVQANQSKGIQNYYEAACLKNLRRYDEAISYYDKVLAMKPNDEFSLNGKSIVISNQQSFAMNNFIDQFLQNTIYKNLLLMSFQGFLVKKTIQQFPIRQNPLYYEDFTDQNLLLFINKKLADLRFQSGSNEISAKRMMNLRIKIPKDKSTEGPKVKRKSPAKQQSKSVKHEEDSNKKLHFKFKSPPVKPEVRLGSYFNDELLKQYQIGPLYQEYKLANLKANLVKLQAKKSYQLNELNHVELDDEEQVNYFLTEICRNHPEIDIGAMLHVDVDKKEQNFDDQAQKLKELIQKRIKQEEAEALMRLEQQYTKNLVSIYKETRYDQFEPEFKKQGQINMCKIKRQKEIQDRMFAEIFKTKQHSPLRNGKPNHYLRNNHKKTPTHRTTLSQQLSPVNNIFISQPDSLQASDLKPSLLTTSYGSESRLPNNLSLKLKTIMDRCEELEGEQKRENEFFQRKLNIMGRELHTHFETARCRYKNADMEIDQNEGFDRFLQENKFKRKLINFQVSQVQNLHEVLSQRAKREMTNNFMGTETERQKLF